MTKTLTSTEPASHKRMLKYKTLSAAFSYPDDNFFKIFPGLAAEKDNLRLEYDRLFRGSEIWLYGAEYTAENEFQRSRSLADINGFYKAFGLEVAGDRPDSLTCELEFMYYVILKESRAPDEEKASVCLDAGRKFFKEHLYPAAKRIAKKIISHAKCDFYLEAGQGLLEFLESERCVIARAAR